MDRNTIIGFALIAAIIIGFSILNRPSQEEIARQQQLRHYRDSVAQANREAEAIRLAEAAIAAQEFEQEREELPEDEVQARLADAFGAFSIAAAGEKEFFTLENERVRVKLSSQGGRIYSVRLKNFYAQEGRPLYLFDGDDESLMNFTFLTNQNRIIHTRNMYFVPVSPVQTDSEGNQMLVLRLQTTEDAHIDFIYTLPADDYMMNFSILPRNMNQVLAFGTNSLEMQWMALMRQQEKGRSFEARHTTLNFRFSGESGVNRMHHSRHDTERLTTRVHWVAFKGQFFSSILIADDAILSANLESRPEANANSPFLKSFVADMVIPFDVQNGTPTNFRMFFGPNRYKILAGYDRGVPAEDRLYLRKIIPMGWFPFINRFMIIPMFNFFSQHINSMGIIILLITIIIKMLLFPLTYKSYMSGAKMRVLKPEIDEINEKIPADKAMERQQATMKLYSKMGVSPLSGCLPMLLQMPFLISLFWFFPTAVELRQQSFLWAADLSTYDAVINLPFTIPFLGSHISLFALLMAVSIFASNKLNMATQSASMGGDQMKMMKMMMNFMPIMMFFFFNSYASGLTYYYFVSTLITVIQMYAIRLTIDDKKLLAELRAKSSAKAAANADKKKKPGFLERLEKMQREQQKAMKERAKKGKR